MTETLKFEDREEVEAFVGLETRRVGLVLDLAGGWSGAFPDSDFDALNSYRWGAWATAGYAGRGVTALGVVRYLDESDLVSSGEGTAFDLGARLIADGGNGALSLSAEGVYRFGNSVAGDRYRVATEVSYGIASDRTIALTFGRDFEGETSGNVLALLRLVANFGDGVRLTNPSTD